MIRKSFIIFLSFAFGGLAGFFLSGPMAPESEVRCDEGLLEREPGYKFVNPLLDCGMEYVELSPFRSKISDLIEKEKAQNHVVHVSVYFRHLNNGYWFGIQERELFSPASLLKVPILMAALKNIETDPSFAEKKAVFPTSKDPNPKFKQSITTGDRLQSGASYSLHELMERMVVDSDNDALPLLKGMIDPAVLVKVFTDLGIEVPSEFKEDYMSIKAYATFFRILYNASYLSAESSEYALSLLTRTKFDGGLKAGIDPGLTVAHKFGERDVMGVRQLHDCGIVYYEKDPYLLCVMTRGRDFAAMTRTIKNISQAVHQDVVRQVQERRR